MSKPMIRIHDANTGEVVDREMTDPEFQAYEKEQLKIQNEILAASQISAEKAALLEKLGITAEEAKLLLS